VLALEAPSDGRSVLPIPVRGGIDSCNLDAVGHDLDHDLFQGQHPVPEPVEPLWIVPRVHVVASLRFGDQRALAHFARPNDPGQTRCSPEPPPDPGRFKTPGGVFAIGHSGLTGENSDPNNPGQEARENSWATGTNPEVNGIYIYRRLISVRPETDDHVANTAQGGAPRRHSRTRREPHSAVCRHRRW